MRRLEYSGISYFVAVLFGVSYCLLVGTCFSEEPGPDQNNPLIVSCFLATLLLLRAETRICLRSKVYRVVKELGRRFAAACSLFVIMLALSAGELALGAVREQELTRDSLGFITRLAPEPMINVLVGAFSYLVILTMYGICVASTTTISVGLINSELDTRSWWSRRLFPFGSEVATYSHGAIVLIGLSGNLWLGVSPPLQIAGLAVGCLYLARRRLRVYYEPRGRAWLSAFLVALALLLVALENEWSWVAWVAAFGVCWAMWLEISFFLTALMPSGRDRYIRLRECVEEEDFKITEVSWVERPQKNDSANLQADWEKLREYLRFRYTQFRLLLNQDWGQSFVRLLLSGTIGEVRWRIDLFHANRVVVVLDRWTQRAEAHPRIVGMPLFLSALTAPTLFLLALPVAEHMRDAHNDVAYYIAMAFVAAGPMVAAAIMTIVVVLALQGTVSDPFVLSKNISALGMLPVDRCSVYLAMMVSRAGPILALYRKVVPHFLVFDTWCMGVLVLLSPSDWMMFVGLLLLINLIVPVVAVVIVPWASFLGIARSASASIIDDSLVVAILFLLSTLRGEVMLLLVTYLALLPWRRVAASLLFKDLRNRRRSIR